MTALNNRQKMQLFKISLPFPPPLFSFTDPLCSDKYHNCMVVVQARLCVYSYYRSVCCASCSRAQETHPNSFQNNHIRRWCCSETQGTKSSVMTSTYCWRQWSFKIGMPETFLSSQQHTDKHTCSFIGRSQFLNLQSKCNIKVDTFSVYLYIYS